MRETTAGITAFSTDDAVTIAAFSLDGVLFAVDLVRSDARPVTVSADSGVVDPRVSPDGRHVAYVVGGSVHVIPLDLAVGSPAPSRLLCG